MHSKIAIKSNSVAKRLCQTLLGSSTKLCQGDGFWRKIMNGICIAIREQISIYFI